MEMKKLDFAQTLQDSFVIGFKNAPSVIAAILLWVITIWIPYINIGTTIAISLLPIELAKGNVISPLAIFDAKYRRYMGEYLITAGLMIIPIFIAFLFLIIPGIVLSIAWSLAYYFLIDKNKNPMQAIKASNDATYGSKWRIFFSSLILVIGFAVIAFIIGAICTIIGSMWVRILCITILYILFYTIGLGYSASVWKQLKDNVE